MLQMVLWDLRSLTRDRIAAGVLLLGLLSAFAAALSGHSWVQQLSAEREGFLLDQANDARIVTKKALSAELDPQARIFLVFSAVRPVAFPLPLLVDFSLGRSDIEPSKASLMMRYRSSTLFHAYQIQNPEVLLRGRLDLAFVAVVLAPLLLIALGYGVFAGDRDRGTARLILAQAGSPRLLLAARSLNRIILAFTPIVLAAMILISWSPATGVDRIPSAALWLFVALLGLLFWWAVILFINSFQISSESAAVNLTGLWTLMVFVAPAFINAGAQALHPPPSRFEQIANARAAEQSAASAYDDDHPTLGTLHDAAWARSLTLKSVRIGRAVEARLAPQALEFDQQLHQEQADVAKAKLFSPPMIVSDALAALAGTDPGTYLLFRQQTFAALTRFKKTIADSIENGQPFDGTLDRKLETYELKPVEAKVPVPVLWLMILTAALLSITFKRLRRPTFD